MRVQRPTLPGVIGIFGVIAALLALNLVTHDDVLTAVVTFVICAGINRPTRRCAPTSPLRGEATHSAGSGRISIFLRAASRRSVQTFR